MNSIIKISDSEKEVMEVIWAAEEWITIPSIHEKLLENKKWAYNTVGTFVQRLCEKGFLQSKREGKANSYKAIVSKDSYKRALTQSFLNEIHNGSQKSLISCLFDVKLSNEKIDKLLEMLNKE
ncbi:MAG: BlaI/MecI/CopY family transcriptional regulator [Epulopiscium sp.]|nr:BlaI/MecI/CopY family transcriptional regulator [Candidatus Epulonipiscium sp.]